MIYICYSSPQSGGRLAYELTRSLLAALGPRIHLAHPPIDGLDPNEPLSEECLWRLDPDSWRAIRAALPTGGVAIFRTAAPPSPALRALAAAGEVTGLAHFRDPRDVLSAPATTDDGAGDDRQSSGEPAGYQQAVEKMERDLACLEEWAGLPGFIVSHHDEVVFRPEDFLRRVAGQLGPPEPDGPDLAAIAARVRESTPPPPERPMPRSYRQRMTIEQAVAVTQRFRRHLETRQGGDLDALDRAFLVQPRPPDPIAAPPRPHPRSLSAILIDRIRPPWLWVRRPPARPGSIYICYGQHKSGSTLAYELTRGLLTALGYPQQRLDCPLIEAEHKVNFLSKKALHTIARDGWRTLQAAIPAGGLVAFKTHLPPPTGTWEWAREGRVLGQAHFRDPRDRALSLRDAGDRARRNGQHSFREMTDWAAVIANIDRHWSSFEQWAGLPGFIRSRYDEVAFQSEAFLARVAAQIGYPDPARLDLPAIAARVKATAFTQFNKGVPRRHRRELTVQQTLEMTRRFRRQIEVGLEGNLDPIDRAMLDLTPMAEWPQSPPLPSQPRLCPRPAPPSIRDAAWTTAFFTHNLFVHTHLEKTAGTTLLKSMQALFGLESVYDLRNPDTPHLDALTPPERDRIRLLSGHFGFGFGERWFERQSIHLACVRDPFERFCSFHAYVQTRPDHPAHSRLGRLTQAEAVRISLLGHHPSAYNYLATKLLGSREESAHPFRQVRHNLEHRYLAVVPHVQVHRLITAVAAAFGLNPPPEMVCNAQPVYSRDETARSLFRRHNQLDYKVFDYIAERYEEWLETLPGRMARMAR